jgi:hypothetical protein
VFEEIALGRKSSIPKQIFRSGLHLRLFVKREPLTESLTLRVHGIGTISGGIDDQSPVGGIESSPAEIAAIGCPKVDGFRPKCGARR